MLLGGDVVLLNSRGSRIVRELESIIGVSGRVIYRVVVSGEDGIEFRVIYGVEGRE